VCDAAFTVIVPGKVNHPATKINDATYSCLVESIKCAQIGNYIGDISSEIETVAKANGYEVVRDFTGHGCGNSLHEDPSIPCYGKKKTGAIICENMVLCIEPMLLTGTNKYYIDKKNNWTVYSKNHKLTCH
jgi:methionyl aminopeptidase